MHIGNIVQKRGSKGIMGIITERPAISSCWKVLWTSGNNRGTTSIIQEDNLVLLKKE